MEILKMIFILDSRGQPSMTKPMVVIAFIAITFKLVIGGFYHFPVVGLNDYALALMAILGGWWAREKTTKELLAKQ